MNKYIMAFDAGTTSERAIIFNKNSEIVSVAQKKFSQKRKYECPIQESEPFNFTKNIT